MSKNKKSIITICVMVNMILSLWLSAGHIIEHEHHGCTQHTCPICCIVKNCEKTVQQLLIVTTILSCLEWGLQRLTWIKVRELNKRTPITLVSLKRLLLN